VQGIQVCIDIHDVHHLSQAEDWRKFQSKAQKYKEGVLEPRWIPDLNKKPDIRLSPVEHLVRLIISQSYRRTANVNSESCSAIDWSCCACSHLNFSYSERCVRVRRQSRAIIPILPRRGWTCLCVSKNIPGSTMSANRSCVSLQPGIPLQCEMMTSTSFILRRLYL
jgi:hypothetical protein